MVKHGCCSREERIIVAKVSQLRKAQLGSDDGRHPIAMSRRHSSHPENGFPFALKAPGIHFIANCGSRNFSPSAEG